MIPILELFDRKFIFANGIRLVGFARDTACTVSVAVVVAGSVYVFFCSSRG